MTNPKLLQCPFCKGLNVGIASDDQQETTGYVKCFDCGARGPVASENETIENLWNRRTGSSDGEAMQWTLADLRRANETRQALWCPDTAQQPDLSFRGNELAGETGEACNEVKKLERERHGWRGSRTTVAKLATELADVVICADLTALTAGINLMDAVRDKFNETSDKVGLPTKLSA